MEAKHDKYVNLEKTDKAGYTDPKQCWYVVHWLGVSEWEANVCLVSIIKELLSSHVCFFLFWRQAQLPYVII